MANKNQYIRVIGIILFFYILSRIDLQELFLSLKNINAGYFTLAIIVLFISPFFGILKWRILIESQNTKVPFGLLASSYLKGIFWGTVTPARAGEFFRVKYLTSATDISNGKAFYTVLLDRLIYVIVLTIVSVVGIIYFLLLNKMENGFPIVVFLLFFLFFIIYFLIKKETTQKILNYIIVRSSSGKKTNYFFEEFFEGMKQLTLVLFLKIIACGFIYYLSSVLVCWFLALSLNIHITFFHLFLIVATNLLLLAIPITILGIGVREAGYIFFFGFFGIKSSLAVAFSELNLIASIILAVPGAILFLKNKY